MANLRKSFFVSATSCVCNPPAADSEPPGYANRYDRLSALCLNRLGCPGLPRTSPSPWAQCIFGFAVALARRNSRRRGTDDQQRRPFHPPRGHHRPRAATRLGDFGSSAMEAWEKGLRWLRPEQRDRIESPDFFQLLQTHVVREVSGDADGFPRHGNWNRMAAGGRISIGRLGGGTTIRRPVRISTCEEDHQMASGHNAGEMRPVAETAEPEHRFHGGVHTSLTFRC